MKIINLNQTSYACPTIFEWTNNKGTNYYFRLRHGYARIANDSTGEVLIEDSFPGADGVCSWDNVVAWAKNKGIKLNKEV